MSLAESAPVFILPKPPGFEKPTRIAEEPPFRIDDIQSEFETPRGPAKKKAAYRTTVGICGTCSKTLMPSKTRRGSNTPSGGVKKPKNRGPSGASKNPKIMKKGFQVGGLEGNIEVSEKGKDSVVIGVTFTHPLKDVTEESVNKE